MRKFVLQVHLWSALICGVYIILISLTGSAVVMRREFGRWFSPPSFIVISGERFEDSRLRASIEAQYPNHEILTIGDAYDERLPIAVTLSRNDLEIERRFNPYTGEDLGDPFPLSLRAMAWLVDLHDNLLSGTSGRRVNGIGGIAFTLIILTGAILWWPGQQRWKRSLTVSWRQTGYQFLWRLHSTLGFWCFALLLVWGITAIYFAFPNPFESAMDYFDPDLLDFERPGERQLLLLIDAHFGRFGPLPIRFVWMTLGLVPIVLLISGFLLWWKKRGKHPIGSQ